MYNIANLRVRVLGISNGPTTETDLLPHLYILEPSTKETTPKPPNIQL